MDFQDHVGKGRKLTNSLSLLKTVSKIIRRVRKAKLRNTALFKN